MKNIIKKWWIGIIVIIVAIIIAIVIIRQKNNEVGTAGINKTEFAKIELGMSQATVNSIIDTNNEWNDNEVYEKCCQEISKSNENHVYRYTYKYLGENGGYAIITYEADYSNGDFFVIPTVSKKEQFNLQ